MEPTFRFDRSKLNLQGILDFYQLTPEASRACVQLASVFEQVADEVLTAFYNHCLNTPGVVRYFKGQDINRLKKAQKSHWLYLLQHGVTEEYINRAIRIGEIHTRIGLNLDWYLGGYALVMGHLSEKMMQEQHKNARRNLWPWAKKKPDYSDSFGTMLRLMMLDMNIAINVLQQFNHQGFEKILNISETFSSELGAQIQHSAGNVAELNDSVKQISHNIFSTLSLTETTSGHMEQVEQSIQQLNTMSGDINQVLSLIRDVAEKTNLLALNAAIESARAGEAGRGFSVVADEVRKLAGTTNQSVNDVSKKLTEIQSLTNAIVQSVQQATRDMKEINHRSADISSAVEQQSVSTEQVYAAMQELDAQSQQASAQIRNEIARQKMN